MTTNAIISGINEHNFDLTFKEISNRYRLVVIAQEHTTNFNYNKFIIIEDSTVILEYECSDRAIYRASSNNGILQFPCMLRLWLRFMQAVEKELQSL